jgi:hypothetical protein
VSKKIKKIKTRLEESQSNPDDGGQRRPCTQSSREKIDKRFKKPLEIRYTVFWFPAAIAVQMWPWSVRVPILFYPNPSNPIEGFVISVKQLTIIVASLHIPCVL